MVHPALRPAIPISCLTRLIAGHAVLATVATFFIVRQSVMDEPYTEFGGGDAFVQIGLASVFAVVWSYVIAGIAYGVLTTRLSRTWLLLLPWAAFMLFLLAIGVQGYLGDTLALHV